jgi:CBS domain-containing protein
MKVREVMSSPVVFVSPETSILSAGDLMLQYHISGLPVVDAAGSVVGVVTERDFLRPPGSGEDQDRLRWFEALAKRPPVSESSEQRFTRKIGDIMTKNPVTVTEDTPVEDVLQLMESRHIKRVPVLRAGALVGIVSRADLLRALMHNLRRSSSTEEIQRSRLTEIERESWLHRIRP